MSDTGAVGGERFDFGRVVGQTFGLIGRNFPLFALLSLVLVGAPNFGLIYVQSSAIAANDIGLVATASLAGALISMIMSFILQGSITRASIDDLSGVGARAGAAIGDGLRFFFPLLLVGILAGIGILVGFVLLIVPGLILMVRWAVTAPVVVVEDVGPTMSFGRSADLSRGHRWAIFGLLLLYLVFSYAVQIIFGMIIGAIGVAAVSPELATFDTTGLVVAVTSAALGALVSLVSTVGVAALYFELRRVKEGVNVSDLAKVFE